jgi:hypothetical protein
MVLLGDAHRLSFRIPAIWADHDFEIPRLADPLKIMVVIGNDRGKYWEYCLFDWKNLYNSRWRIRPLYVFNYRTLMAQHVPGGMAHWLFKL